MRLGNGLRPFTPSGIEAAADARGVYALYIDQSRVIFLGRAFGNTVFGTVRQELLKHRNGDYGPCTQNATEFSFEVSDDPEHVLGVHLEAYVLRRDNPEGKLPECNSPSDRGLIHGCHG